MSIMGTTTNRTMTPRQAAILKWIVGCWAKGYVPTVRDIGEQFDIGSPNGVMCHLTALRKKGFLEQRGNKALKLTKAAMGMARHGRTTN